MKTNNIFDIIFVGDSEGKRTILSFFRWCIMLILKGQKIFKTDDARYRYWRESRQKSRDSATRIYEGFVMATVLLGPFQQKITKAQKDNWNDHNWCLCGVWSFLVVVFFFVFLLTHQQDLVSRQCPCHALSLVLFVFVVFSLCLTTSLSYC